MKVDSRDINIVKSEEVPDCDALIGDSPCQAFSIAGYREGLMIKKGRSNLFFEMCIFIEAKRPKIIFLENVKNLVGHDDGNTFRVILYTLEKLNYHAKYQVLNVKDYGNIPHGCERMHIVGFSDIDDYRKFKFPNLIKLTKKLTDVIDFSGTVDSEFYSSATLCNFYDKLENEMIKNETIYQWHRVYVREYKSNICQTLTANMGTCGHNVPLIKTNDNKIRKLTSRECFNIQGFEADYAIPNISNILLYKQAGKSAVVPVIKRIAEKIIEAIEE